MGNIPNWNMEKVVGKKGAKCARARPLPADVLGGGVHSSRIKG